MPSADKLIEIFHEAKRRSPGDEQDAFLAQACGDNAELRERVNGLLRAHEAAGGFLNAGPSFSPGIEAELARLKPVEVGERIGPYVLREQIGEGGFGVVWVAEQLVPVRRTVALKIIKMGMDTKEVVARFEQERQALAMMDHPNIARVIEAGATEHGRPYFVMELVRGIKITDYCDQANLPTAQRLELFVQVCQAVQHAHQKGIIHRDLKPSNILVTLHDGVPVPKVIDFGVAKATQGRIVEQTIYTQFQQMIGTPLYMSPEQAEMSGLDVDTRTDIYALGVLLYELLTGRTPFDAETLMKAGFDEMRRVIREEEPQKPSTALDTMANEKLTAVANHRGSEPPKLIHAVHGDLDWIVMKCLEKDRTRRYETANGLATDLKRHLTNEPVFARPPSRAYQFRKLVRRNKLAFFAGSAIAAALVIGLAIATWMYFRESHARQRATQAERLATERLEAKETALKEAEAVSTFITEVFQSPSPTLDGRSITVAEMLDRAAQKLETNLMDQPALRARLQSTLGKTYNALGLPHQGIPLLEKAMNYHRAASGREHPDALDTMFNLAYPYGGRWDEVLKVVEELLPQRRKVLGPEHPDTLSLISWLAASYVAAGRLDEALKLREELLTLDRKVLGPEHPKTLGAMWALVDSYVRAGRKDEAIKLSEETLRLKRKVFGPEFPETLTAMLSLAYVYFEFGHRDEALKLREEGLVLRRKVLGPDHVDTLEAMDNLAESYTAADRQDEAIELREEVLAILRKVPGSHNPSTLVAMRRLSDSYRSAGRRDEAAKLQEEARALQNAAPTKQP